MKLRVGLIGLGDAWESRHRPALRSLVDRFEVRAVCSGVAVLAEQAAEQFRASQVDGFRALTNRPDIDAVLLLEHEWYGALPILAACEAGKAVYCAPVLDLDPTQAIQLRDRVQHSGVAFMAEFPKRQSPATLRLKELIATRLGKPRMLFCHARMKPEQRNGRVRNYAPSNPAGRGTRQYMEMVDWCRYLVGNEPSSVLGVRHQGPLGKSDYRMMSLDFSPPGQPGAGALAQISVGNYIPRNWDEAVNFRPPAELQICCEHGVAFVDLPSTLVWFNEAGQHREALDSERPVGEQLFMQFHRAVTSLVRKTSDLDDAYRALHIVTAAQASHRQGQRLPLEL